MKAYKGWYKLSGTELIGVERAVQRLSGFDSAHDAEHKEGELIKAALAYLAIDYEFAVPPTEWPWEDSYFKPHDRIRNLVKAGALIAAEIDRLQND